MDPTPEQISGAYKKMNEWRQDILEGASFARLAELHSTSPEASQGGGMGWFLPGALAPRFASVFSLKVGELSQVIRSPGGLHLFSVTNERWQEPNKLAEAYDEIHVRHILLKNSNLMSDKEKAKLHMRAAQIAKEMQDATDEEFATRAKEISQGPSAPKGGDLGWFKRGAMLPEFEEAAFQLEAGQTSGIVETRFGLHIIRVVERRHIEPDSLEAHHDDIQNILLNIEMQDQLPRWLSGLKTKATIEYRACQ
jgi:peptidyl-prolyl cis-trans isomerase SurA